MATAPTPEQLANAAKLVESADAYKKVLKETADLQAEITRATAAASDVHAKLAAIDAERTDALAAQLSTEEGISKALEMKEKINNRISAIQEQMVGQAGDELKILQENLLRERGSLQTTIERNALKERERDLASKTLADLAKQEKVQKKLQKDESDALKNMTKLQEQFGDAVKDNIDAAELGNERLLRQQEKIAKKIPIVGSVFGKVLDMKKSTMDFGTQLQDLGAEMGPYGQSVARAGTAVIDFAKGIGFAGLAAIAMITKLAMMGNEVNKLSKALGAATGFGDQFNTEITEMATAGQMAGIGFEQSAAALTALTAGLSSFNPNAEETNMHVGMTVARLEKLGVASASSVKSIDHMQRAMGLSAEKAADLTAQIARAGKEIGITGTKMINDFNAASGRLAIYGDQNIKVFKQLAAQAKATGIEMNSLLTISKNFDTFDSAADHAAQLNAVLGTQLSTIEMLNATDSERIMILKQEIQSSVGNFDALDKHTKQYIQQAMGVASVDEAQRLLNMSTSEYQKLQDGQKESADIQAEMAEATEKLVPLMDQLKLAGMQFFMVFSPIIEGFAALISYMSPLVGFLGQAAKGLGVLAVAWLLVNIQAGGFAAIMTALGWIALVGAITLVVAGLGYLADGFVYLYKIFKKKINPDFAQIFNFLADSLMAMVSPLAFVKSGVDKITGAFGGLFKTAKKDAKAVTKDGFSIKAMAELDTTKISEGFKNIKSAVMELSNIKMDGFLAMKTDGTSSSFVMGSDGLIKSISEGKLVVDVKMPEMQMPDVSVKVYIGNKELKDIIRTEVKAVVGRAG